MTDPIPDDLVPATVPCRTVEGWYCELASILLQNPGISTFDIADIMKKSPKWVATIRASDAFTEYFKRQCDRAADDIQRKTRTLVELAMDRLIDRVASIGDAMPTNDLHEIVDRGAKRLGYGQTVAPAHLAVNVGVTVGRDDLEAARRRMHEKFGVTTESPAISLPSMPGTTRISNGNAETSRSVVPAASQTIDGEIVE